MIPVGDREEGPSILVGPRSGPPRRPLCNARPTSVIAPKVRRPLWVSNREKHRRSRRGGGPPRGESQKIIRTEDKRGEVPEDGAGRDHSAM